MNRDIVAGKWQQLKGEIQKTWGDLTDDDLDRAQGSAEKLEGVLREKYGWSKEVATKQVADLMDRMRSRLDDTASGRYA
jgi:uncharacterized protein YjbJ (UPF0337 family)